jgi:hypothetical protein
MTANIQRLAGRAVVDREFRRRLLADPEGAAACGLSLSAEELAQLRGAAAHFAYGEADPKALDSLQGTTW